MSVSAVRSRWQAMSSGNNGSRNVGLELNLNQSPPPLAAAERIEVDGGHEDEYGDDYSNGSSSPSSCVSSDDGPGGGEASPMVIGACERCLLYCMVTKEEYPICINCKQPFLVDVLPAGDDKKRGKRQ
uniref:Uncharacterized protein n=2 Tax=Hordeum vulgare subsp. vulgare TaxID=112509 RepID=A0A8I6XDK5_HORVV